ncbi:cytochrome P450 7B1 isoform X2 [Chanos chanos]|uniref:Cytochrome P450 7B1 isoform X2 n=1 Tax=Chanos chanos TaxID=29144 RepID=A0A6J2VD73_CHACN|nr:cytochrome P450 7B1-like isoform X2 [Chanos chanos]
MLEFLLTLFLGAISLFLFSVLFGRKWREGEPPLIKGWIPFVGKTLEFRKDSHQFLTKLQQQYGDVFTVLIAGKYMTFVMDPLLYPSVIKRGRQLDFHDFSDQAASVTFGYPAVRGGRFPGLSEQIQKLFRLLQGDSLDVLTFRMMGNLQVVLRRSLSIPEGAFPKDDWQAEDLYEFCYRVMFEATFLSIYGRPEQGAAHPGMNTLQENFRKFDSVFPLLIARVPIALLGQTKGIRQKLLSFFHPCRIGKWIDPCEFVQRRVHLFDQYDTLGDLDKAAHHFAILWASVGNTIPAAFWSLYHLLTHPEALAAVRQEIMGVVSQEEAESICTRDITLTREQLDRLIYLESALNESLRLSSASMNIRVVQEDFTLSLDAQRAVNLRKGDFIVLHPQSMHMDPDIYPQPRMYRFDRFVEAGREKTDFYKHSQKLHYYRMPFGSGSTQCPGRFFAVNELKQFICVVLLMFQLELPAGQEDARLDTSRAGLGILPPANHITLRYRPNSLQQPNTS